MEDSSRRLPVYILLDCSESMVGEGIDAVQKGLNCLLDELRADPHALETVWVSIITFANRAEQAVPFSALASVTAPALRVRPGTSLGGALELLLDSIKREVVLHTSTTKGDWKPVVFLLTDGVPTDEWQPAAEAIRRFHKSSPLNIVAIACGEDVDPFVLRQLSTNVLAMHSYTNGDFRRLFQWISASLSAMSRQVSSNVEDPVRLPEIPADVLGLPAERVNRGDLQWQLFICARCSRTGKPYLIRYRLDSRGTCYEPVRTHCVDEGYFEGQDQRSASLTVQSSQIAGVLPCPYCGNAIAGTCQCGAIFCCETSAESVVCPSCHAHLVFDASSSDFSISGRKG